MGKEYTKEPMEQKANLRSLFIMLNILRLRQALVNKVEGILKSVRKYVWIIGPYIPCTLMNNVWRNLDKNGGSVLDIGGGLGEPMKFLSKRLKFRLRVNADITLSRLEEAKRSQTHDEYILCDARRLPFRGEDFDIILITEVIEHLEKEEGFKLLSCLEEIACKQIVLTTPVNPSIGLAPKERIADDPGHISSWYPAEFKKIGYKVRGSNFPSIHGNLLIQSRSPFLSLLGYVLYVVASPFVYFFPSKAGHMTCVKYLSKSCTSLKN